MRYLHSMVRVTDLQASLKFYCDALGLVELYRNDVPAGRFTLVFLGADADVDVPFKGIVNQLQNRMDVSERGAVDVTQVHVRPGDGGIGTTECRGQRF